MFFSGDYVLYDRSLKAVFVRYVGDDQAIIRVGMDTRIVDVVTLSREEA